MAGRRDLKYLQAELDMVAGRRSGEQAAL
jgi:hypothetical protein